MPFDCRADGGRVALAPSPDRSYAIVGAHESEIFSACSPRDPNRCRSWFVHRFDLDCGGTRVAWIDVAEAARRYYDRPGWVENGSFHFRMGPLWTFEGGDAFRDGQRRWMREGGSPARYYGPDGARDDSRIVTLPPGYAPARGIPVSFSGVADARSVDDEYAADDAPAGVAMAPSPARPPATENYAASPAPAAPPAPEPIPELPKRAPRQEIAEAQARARPATAAVPLPEEAPADKLVIAEAAKTAASIVNRDAESKPEPAPSAPKKSAGVTIINAPGAQAPSEEPAPEAADAADAADAGEAQAVEPPVAEEAAPSGSTDIATGSMQEAAGKEDVVAAADPVSEPPMSVAPPSLLPGGTKSFITPTTIFATVALALAVIAATFGFRRRPPELVHVTPPAARDYGSVSLGGFDMPAPAPGPSLALPAAVEPDISGHSNNSLAMTPDFPVPSTYEQALDVLGASPDASLPAIKKIVDGLRQNWHPDHARSESDRLYRESRSRQINVAWDLVSQRRPAA